MNYPKFFDDIENIKLKDDLANFLGAVEDGLIEFSYLDVVKTAGHSCPTVLGAYLMTLEALKVLYKDDFPKRGGIKVVFKERQSDGVAGVIANVISNITGACTNNGFKGIAGLYSRNMLLEFEQDIGDISARFIRIDSNKSVDITYDPSQILPDKKMKSLMEKSMQGVATNQEKKEFGTLWQNRVEKISKDINKVISIKENS